jgi:hypothetical protein
LIRREERRRKHEGEKTKGGHEGTRLPRIVPILLARYRP